MNSTIHMISLMLENGFESDNLRLFLNRETISQ